MVNRKAREAWSSRAFFSRPRLATVGLRSSQTTYRFSRQHAHGITLFVDTLCRCPSVHFTPQVARRLCKRPPRDGQAERNQSDPPAEGRERSDFQASKARACISKKKAWFTPVVHFSMDFTLNPQF
jgi:hypothetical protein